jgi:hypothetical protein
MTSDENPPPGAKDPKDPNRTKGEVQKLRADNAAPNTNVDGDEVCSFCGKGPKEVNALVSKGSVRICDLCVNAARAGLGD